MDSIIYCLGVDPAKEKATLCLIDSKGKVVIAPFDASSDREGFDHVKERLIAVLEPHDELLVGIEATAALDDNWLAFFPDLKKHCRVNLMRLDAAQVKAFTGAKPIRSKTDNADARRIANFLRIYASELECFVQDSEHDAMLAILSERESTIVELTRLKNRLQDRLILCFPEFARIIGNPYSSKALALLELCPSAQALARKHTATIAQVKGPGRGARRVGEEIATKLKEGAKTSVASQSGEPFEGLVQRLVRRIRFLSDQLEECNALIDAFVASDRKKDEEKEREPTEEKGADPQGEPAAPSIPKQCDLLTTLPGVSNVTAATIVLRSRGIGRFHTAKAFAAQLAANPARCQTGTTKDRARLSKRGDRRARSSLFMATMCATRSDVAFEFYKWLHESSGQTPKQAICSVMNRMARLMWTLTIKNTPYDQSQLLTNIKEHHGKKWREFLSQKQAKKVATQKKKSLIR